MHGYKFNHLATNSTIAVAVEARVNLALPATAMVEFVAKWLNLQPRTVLFDISLAHGMHCTGFLLIPKSGAN